MPKLLSVWVMMVASAGDVGEHPAGLMADGELSKMVGLDSGRTCELGCTAYCHGRIDILPEKQQDGEFLIRQALLARVHDTTWRRRAVMVTSTNGSEFDECIQSSDTKLSRLPQQVGGRRGFTKLMGKGGHWGRTMNVEH